MQNSDTDGWWPESTETTSYTAQQRPPPRPAAGLRSVEPSRRGEEEEEEEEEGQSTCAKKEAFSACVTTCTKKEAFSACVTYVEVLLDLGHLVCLFRVGIGEDLPSERERKGPDRDVLHGGRIRVRLEERIRHI